MCNNWQHRSSIMIPLQPFRFSHSASSFRSSSSRPTGFDRRALKITSLSLDSLIEISNLSETCSSWEKCHNLLFVSTETSYESKGKVRNMNERAATVMELNYGSSYSFISVFVFLFPFSISLDLNDFLIIQSTCPNHKDPLSEQHLQEMWNHNWTNGKTFERPFLPWTEECWNEDVIRPWMTTKNVENQSRCNLKA